MKVKGSQVGWGFWLGWVVASTVGWVLAKIVSRAIPWDETGDFNLMPMVMTGAVLGMVTGAALVWLLRQPVPEA